MHNSQRTHSRAAAVLFVANSWRNGRANVNKTCQKACACHACQRLSSGQSYSMCSALPDTPQQSEPGSVQG